MGVVGGIKAGCTDRCGCRPVVGQSEISVIGHHLIEQRDQIIIDLLFGIGSTRILVNGQRRAEDGVVVVHGVRDLIDKFLINDQPLSNQLLLGLAGMRHVHVHLRVIVMTQQQADDIGVILGRQIVDKGIDAGMLIGLLVRILAPILANDVTGITGMSQQAGFVQRGRCRFLGTDEDDATEILGQHFGKLLAVADHQLTLRAVIVNTVGQRVTQRQQAQRTGIALRGDIPTGRNVLTVCRLDSHGRTVVGARIAVGYRIIGIDQ